MFKGVPFRHGWKPLFALARYDMTHQVTSILVLHIFSQIVQNGNKCHAVMTKPFHRICNRSIMLHGPEPFPAYRCFNFCVPTVNDSVGNLMFPSSTGLPRRVPPLPRLDEVKGVSKSGQLKSQPELLGSGLEYFTCIMIPWMYLFSGTCNSLVSSTWFSLDMKCSDPFD
jgi:hypothetical protein